MIIKVAHKDMVAKVTYAVCHFHKENPSKQYAGCTCSTCYSYVKVGGVPKEDKDASGV